MMKFEEWVDTFHPIANPLIHYGDDDCDFDDNDPCESEEKFEIYGIELGFVLGVAEFNPRNIWTLIDTDAGMSIVSGYHLCDRVNYFVTRIPFEGEFLEVEYFLNAEEDEDQAWTDHCLITANGTEQQIEEYITTKENAE